ncbi:MAG: biopolymer transporter ExbD [Pseudomonadaceae bacterium]|nr:biopolymer transporter ExbD [Pseudomonadaceae bacterium]
MKFRRGNRFEASVELTPLIDVVFLLLIFFMVSTTFVRETQLKIDLPEAQGEASERDPDVVEIAIDRSGGYAINGQSVANKQLQTLMRALEATTEGDSSKSLIITADANASHQSVVRAMDAAGRLGLTRLSITTTAPEDEG